MKVVTSEQMRQLEQATEAEGTSTGQLMENAGLATAHAVRRVVQDEVMGKRIAVLVGPGNNGGDGMVAARHLATWGADVVALLAARRPDHDPLVQSLEDAGIQIAFVDDVANIGRARRLLDSSDVVLDALLGTGRNRPLSGALREVLLAASEIRAQRASMGYPLTLVALDVPSGVDADTGAADTATPHVDATVTLGFPKVGLFLFPAAAHTGHLEVVDIGIPARLAEGLTLELLTPAQAASLLPQRPLDGHKGTFGRVLVVGGSRPYVGAPVLAARGAARGGAGLVELAAPASIQHILAANTLESVHLPLPEFDGAIAGDGAPLVLEAAKRADAVLIGPGMGQTESAQAFTRVVLSALRDVPVVLDADALNNLAQLDAWPKLLRTQAVLTPHPGEMARMTGKSAAAVNGARVEVAQTAAKSWGQVVVLKGAYTVVAAPDGRASINPFANPALATAGTGDVLAGLIAGLLAQGLTPYDAARLGAYLHAMAGERVRARIGDAGLLASDLPPEIPLALRELRHVQHTPIDNDDPMS